MSEQLEKIRHQVGVVIRAEGIFQKSAMLVLLNLIIKWMEQQEGKNGV